MDVDSPPLTYNWVLGGTAASIVGSGEFEGVTMFIILQEFLDA